jgi:hypothetical protein
MNNEKVEYWTKFAFTKMRKEKTIMPTTIEKVLELDEFKSSGVTEEELRQSIKEKFAVERQEIVSKIKQKLKNLKDKDND